MALKRRSSAAYLSLPKNRIDMELNKQFPSPIAAKAVNPAGALWLKLL